MRIVWTELWVNDLDESIAFYTALFGWTFEQFTDYDENYYIARSDSVEQPNVAIVKRPENAVVSHKTAVPYFNVSSIEKYVRHIGVHDVTITELPHSGGRFCMLQDPTGNWIGLWESPVTQQ